MILPLFQLKNIQKTFGATQALKDVSLEINQGEHIALIGPSGSGKTTLLKLLNGQHMHDQGSIHISELSLDLLTQKELRSLRSNIAYIPQDLGLVPSLKVFQNLLLGRIGKHSFCSLLRQFLLPKKSEMQQYLKLLDRVGIAEKLYQTTSTLSGGQQQRTAVARALYQNAHTILADEPVSAVDPARARSLIQLLQEVATENNLTLVMSIHNLDLAQELFPRLIGMKAGSIFFDKSAPSVEEIKELYHLPESELVD